MRIKMLETVNTVGQILEYDKVYEIDTPLAAALIERGQAVDPFVAVIPKPAAPTFEFRPKETVPSVDPVPEPVSEPAAKKPAKKAAAK